MRRNFGHGDVAPRGPEGRDREDQREDRRAADTERGVQGHDRAVRRRVNRRREKVWPQGDLRLRRVVPREDGTSTAAAAGLLLPVRYSRAAREEVARARVRNAARARGQTRTPLGRRRRRRRRRRRENRPRRRRRRVAAGVVPRVRDGGRVRAVAHQNERHSSVNTERAQIPVRSHPVEGRRSGRGLRRRGRHAGRLVRLGRKGVDADPAAIRLTRHLRRRRRRRRRN
mmetsp:Transcript_9700/g.35285  ORF Transcript_9700/g.35285 Transcript_9700/m.35285 type:complete len:228 (+) Transcript_9700:1004-1687(+)